MGCLYLQHLQNSSPSEWEETPHLHFLLLRDVPMIRYQHNPPGSSSEEEPWCSLMPQLRAPSDKLGAVSHSVSGFSSKKEVNQAVFPCAICSCFWVLCSTWPCSLMHWGAGWTSLCFMALASLFVTPLRLEVLNLPFNIIPYGMVTSNHELIFVASPQL